MRVRAFVLFLFLLLVPPSARAEDTLQSDVAKELASDRAQAVPDLPRQRPLRGAALRNYTSGVRVTWFDAARAPSGLQ